MLLFFLFIQGLWKHFLNFFVIFYIKHILYHHLSVFTLKVLFVWLAYVCPLGLCVLGHF